MAFGNACLFRHAIITDFDVEFIANLVEAVVRREVLVDETKELLADVGFNFHIV